MSKILLNSFGKPIEDAVKNTAALRTFVKGVETYIDRNSAIIFDQAPSKRLIFSNREKKILYDFLQINPDDVTEKLKSVASIKASWQFLNDPFIILSMYLIRELDKQKKKKELEIAIMFLALRAYSSRQVVYFGYGANEQVMNYTINNLSEKFKYRTMKNNYDVIRDTVMTSHNTYSKELLKGEDIVLNTYYGQFYSRINKMIKNVAVEFYKNLKEKKYLNAVKSHDDELGGELDIETSSAMISGLAESSANYFIGSAINVSLLRTVATRNKVPYPSLSQCLLSMKEKGSTSIILELYSSTLSALFNADKAVLSRVCSRDFAVKAIKLISVSNSKDKSLLRVKEILDSFLEEYCTSYATTERRATKIAYRSALYSYLTYILIANKCR